MTLREHLDHMAVFDGSPESIPARRWLAELDALERSRDELAHENASYARHFGAIEAVLGIAGAHSLDEAVRMARERVRALESDQAAYGDMVIQRDQARADRDAAMRAADRRLDELNTETSRFTLRIRELERERDQLREQLEPEDSDDLSVHAKLDLAEDAIARWTERAQNAEHERDAAVQRAEKAEAELQRIRSEFAIESDESLYETVSRISAAAVRLRDQLETEVANARIEGLQEGFAMVEGFSDSQSIKNARRQLRELIAELEEAARKGER